MNKKIIYVYASLFFLNATAQIKIELAQSKKDYSLEEQALNLIMENEGKFKHGMKMPQIIAQDLQGQSFNSKNLGKIVFYSFWFKSCAPCIEEIPLLNRIEKQFRDRVNFIAITYESHEDVKSFLEEHPSNFKQILLSREEIDKLEICSGYPTNVITCDGEIIYCYHGGPASKKSELYTPLILNLYQSYLNSITKCLQEK